MDSRAKALGHAIHPMLIVFPLGLLTTAVIFDILFLATDRAGFATAAAYAIAVGVLGGLAAALFPVSSTGWPYRPARGPAASGSGTGWETLSSWACSP